MKPGFLRNTSITKHKTKMDFQNLFTRKLSSAKRPGAVVFNAGCNEQVFSPKIWKKKTGADPSCRFREKRKPIPKK